MNRRMVLYLIGIILMAEGALMVPSFLVGLIYGEDAASAFVLPMMLELILGFILSAEKPKDSKIFAREGYVVTAAGWIGLSVFGAIPFYLCRGFNSVWDCIFEIVSGFTTTGASVLSKPEDLPKCILFWRSFSHWVGGMGVLVFVLAIVPMAGERSLHLMRAESPGPVVGKLVPRMRDTSRILYTVYSAMTLLLIILLRLGGMPIFDAICYGFGTAGTGGFSISSSGITGYNSVYIEVVLGIFMLLFGVNFNIYYLLLIGRFRETLKSEELRAYGITIVLAVSIVTLNILRVVGSFGEALREAFFQVSSILTTTGFATVDFSANWPQLSRHLLLILMLMGAMAGSTAGGLKVSRFLLLLKSGGQEVQRLRHPRLATVVTMDGKGMDREALHDTRTYFTLYVAIIVFSTFLLSLEGFDLETNLSSVIACFNNIGPGLNLVGPMESFELYSPAGKMLLSLCMLMGRLEIYPMIVLLSPQMWRRGN